MTEGGTDPHRDNWVPVPLLAKKYDPETKTYFIEFEAPKQLLLNEQYHALVHDELLRNADRDGLIIEGQIMVTERDKDAPVETDPTIERDKTVQEVLKDPAKEEEVQAEQDAIESPYKMSEAEKEYRARMRQNLRETADEAFGFVQRNLDGRPLPEGQQMRVDRDAFLEGFFGAPMTPPKREVMVVRAEAMVAMSLSTLESTEETKADEPSMPDPDAVDFEIPDDLSGLDG